MQAGSWKLSESGPGEAARRGGKMVMCGPERGGAGRAAGLRGRTWCRPAAAGRQSIQMAGENTARIYQLSRTALAGRFLPATRFLGEK